MPENLLTLYLNESNLTGFKFLDKKNESNRLIGAKSMSLLSCVRCCIVRAVLINFMQFES
jgi:hypothetical protein